MVLRVALISSSYAPYPGGVEEHTRNVARVLRSAGNEVQVWTVDRGEHLGTQQLDGITVCYLPTPLPSASVCGVGRFALVAIPAWRAWRLAQREFRPDVLHVQCFGPNGVYALGLHSVTRTPLVLSAHGETFMDEHEVFTGSRLLSAALRRSLQQAEEVTGCSSMVLDDLTGRFGLSRAGLVVPNGVDSAEGSRLGVEASHAVDDQPFTVFAVGRAVRVKGFDLLIRAFATARLPDSAKLVIGGDGPEMEALRALAGDLGISGRVNFLGRLDREGVLRGMGSADVVVVPSRLEAFGIVVLEAWRSGTALLATSRGGPAELVTDGVDGMVVDPSVTDEFAARLSLLARDPLLRQELAAGGLRTVQRFTWERTAGEYSRLYEQHTRPDRPLHPPRAED